MKLKTNLHLHTKEDIIDGVKDQIIDYSIYEMIDRAKESGFQVLAFTPHEEFVYKGEFGSYAREKEILLIPGIELSLKGFFFQPDILVLNCEKSIDNIKTFSDLAEYKKKHPEIFIIAPHPGFGMFVSVGLKNLEKYIDLFDAIEHSWFYSKFLNLNKGAERIAKKYKKPFIATSDAHTFDYLDSDYAVLEAEDLSIKSVFQAIRNFQFKNCTREKKITEMAGFLFYTNFRIFLSFLRKLFKFRQYELFKSRKSN